MSSVRATLPSSPARQRILDAADFGRVALLMGGDSAERDISLLTGKAVVDALLSRGVQVEPVDAAGSDLAKKLLQGGYDRVFNALHGPGGEDGVVAGLLRLLELPCTGSGHAALALSMDKHFSKLAFAFAGIPTPAWRLARSLPEAHASSRELGLPVGLKPNNQGSSLGISRVDLPSEIDAAYRDAVRYGSEVIVESWIEGGEYTASMLQGEMLPVVRIVPPEGDFYDFHTKYESAGTRYLCPCGLAPDREAEINRQAQAAIRELRVSGWARVDLMLDSRQDLWVLEVNTVPGMTAHSLVPMAAAEAGVSFGELCWRILETSFNCDSSNPGEAQ